MVSIYPIAVLLATLLAVRSYRRRSLTTSGSVAAFVIGYATMANPSPLFGACLIVFFVAGTSSTKYKRDIKERLVREHEAAPSTSQIEAPGRDWRQVLCNSWIGTLCAVLYRLRREGVLPSSLDVVSDQTLICGAVSFWGTCAGDTLASELGLLSKSPPRLITTFKTVAPGVNGAVSAWGTLLSLIGGALVGITAAIATFLAANPSLTELTSLIVVGTASGLIGSGLDSFFGAVVQQTRYSKKEQRIVPTETPLGGEGEVVVLAGADLLSNNQVNVVSTTITTGAFMLWASRP